MPIDAEALRKIADLPFVIRADAPHAPEHALEVELPFLQTLLGSFQLVPLVVGDAAPQDVAHVLRQLWAGLETLIVVSSDLSHYHSYEAARRLDLATAAAIERGDWASLGPNRSLWLPPGSRLARGSRAPWPQGPAAVIVQFRRHGGLARPGRWVRSLDVRVKRRREL